MWLFTPAGVGHAGLGALQDLLDLGVAGIDQDELVSGVVVGRVLGLHGQVDDRLQPVVVEALRLAAGIGGVGDDGRGQRDAQVAQPVGDQVGVADVVDDDGQARRLQSRRAPPGRRAA